MISVIDMPPPEESIWWRGKRGFEVGFFPCECVEVIGDKVPHNLNLPHNSSTLPHPHTHARRDSSASESPSEPTKPVLRKHGKLITFFRSFILSRPARGKLKKSGILKERVFGCDLGEHLLNTGQDVPKVLKHCSTFIEAKGIVDGIYRLSGISSNIQRLRVAFDEDRIPDLFEDRLVLQDIHSVSSLLKMYFRELPNPVCTFHLYEQFVEAARSGDDVRLPKLRDVVSQLPPPNYRTLEYLTKHLHRVSLKHGDTGMTAKNVAIVWAPNLLRCKSLEVGGVAALQGVGVQAVVTEYLIKYCELIFSDKLPAYSVPAPAPVLGESQDLAPGTQQQQLAPVTKCRPKSLAISTPTKLLTLEEARSRALTACNNIENQKYIEVGGGPDNLPAKYHTVIELPGGKKGGSFKHKKSTAWKSIFSGKEKKKSSVADRKISTPSDLVHLSSSQMVHHPASLDTRPVLRPVKSAESLVPCGAAEPSVAATPLSGLETADTLGPLEAVTQAVGEHRRQQDSPKCHSRSSSHDSYFERKLSVQFKMDMEDEPEEDVMADLSDNIVGEAALSPSPKMKVDSSLDISEIQMNFDLEDNEMKIFSEDEAMMSTSVGSELSLTRSPLDEVMFPATPSLVGGPDGSPGPVVTRGSNQRPESELALESPSKTRRMSFKEKFRKFTSPTLSRKQNEPSKMVDSGVGFDSDSCSGSFENKSFDESKKSAKLKEKIVSALSPESLRKRPESGENSPKKKKKSTVSPSASPNIRSLVKRSKIEDEAEDRSSLNMSPSIKFIDASSSYELGLGLSSETLDDTRSSPRLQDDNWNEGAETVREKTVTITSDLVPVVEESDKAVVEVEVHEPDTSHNDHDLGQDPVAPISIIGASVEADPEADKESLVSELSNTVSFDTKRPVTQETEEGKDATKDAHLAQDVSSLHSQTSDGTGCGTGSLSSKDESSEISVSYAGATVSENESFGVQSTPASSNEEDHPSDTDDKTETIRTVIAQDDCKQAEDDLAQVEPDEVIDNAEEIAEEEKIAALECMKSIPSITKEQEKDDDSAVSNQGKFAMEIDDDKKNTQKVDDEVDTEDICGNEECPMETDMTILSAEISANNRLYEKSENKTVFNDFHFGNFNYESDSEKSESSSSPGHESNTSERCREVETSAPTSEQSSPQEDAAPSLVLNLDQDYSISPAQEPEVDDTDNQQKATDDVDGSKAESSDLVLDLQSCHQLQSPVEAAAVLMRRSPSSPARNRSVRSDFLANFVVETQDRSQEPPSPQLDIGRPPLPKTTPPKFTGIAKALSPQPYNKPSSSHPLDSGTILARNKFPRSPASASPATATDPVMFTAECSVRSSPSPQLQRRDLGCESAAWPTLVIEEKADSQEVMVEDTAEDRVPDHGSRHQSLSPDHSMDTSEPDHGDPLPHSSQTRCLSLEPDLGREEAVVSPCVEESGRRSTQGIPEVERNVKFSSGPESSLAGKNHPDNRSEGSAAKNRSKSSTLSLHAVAASREKEEEPALQRRNSIHNVPFVDVNDPDTRTRMERYKEERRSMLRAKYKAEDYLSSSFSRKKKHSTTSQDSETEPASLSSPSSPDPEVQDDNSSPPPSLSPVSIKDNDSTEAIKQSQYPPQSETNVSTKFLKLKQPEQQREQSFISKAFVSEPKNEIFYKTEVAVASVQKKSSNMLNINKQQPRPDELRISESNSLKENNLKNLAKSPQLEDDGSSSPEENVNVRERASIFGPRKFTETKMRTVSAPVTSKPSAAEVTKMLGKQNRHSSQSYPGQNQTSPSKIRNMAAMFEQNQ